MSVRIRCPICGVMYAIRKFNGRSTTSCSAKCNRIDWEVKSKMTLDQQKAEFPNRKWRKYEFPSVYSSTVRAGRSL